MVEKGLDPHKVNDFLKLLSDTPECITLEPDKKISKEELEAYRIKRSTPAN